MVVSVYDVIFNQYVNNLNYFDYQITQVKSDYQRS